MPKCRTCGERHRLGQCGASSKNTPEASGTASKAPSGLSLGKPKRDSVRASTIAKVGDGVALTSMAHPPGLIEKIAGAIRSGKLKTSPPNPRAKPEPKQGALQSRSVPSRNKTTGSRPQAEPLLRQDTSTSPRGGKAGAAASERGDVAAPNSAKRAPRGTFDRTAYQRDYMRRKRQAGKTK